MRHLYECQMRWADMDMLGHVNNVTYADYLQEARIDMLAAHAPVRGGERLAEGVVVVRHEVEFVAPLVFRDAKVSVECWVTRIRAATFTMAYEIFDETHEGRRVYLRATSVLSPFVFDEERPRRIDAEERAALESFMESGAEPAARIPALGPDAGNAFDLWVRWSDVDAYGHVNNVKYFEFFQEARIQYIGGLRRTDSAAWSHWVVARADVDYRRPILFRLVPYVVRTVVTHVGRTSMQLVSEVRDGDQVLARSRVVLVGFDKESQRAAPMAPRQRELLLAELVD